MNFKIQYPSDVFDCLKHLPVIIRSSLEVDISSDYVVMNSPRPLFGDKQWKGVDCHGVFYAAVKLADRHPDLDFTWKFGANLQDEAWPVLVMSLEMQQQIALSFLPQAYREHLGALQSRDRALYDEILDHHVKGLQMKRFECFAESFDREVWLTSSVA